MTATAALARHAGLTDEFSLITTPFVVNDRSANVEEAAAALNPDLTETDPEFEDSNHPAMEAYVASEAKKGVGMGGVLVLAVHEGIPIADIRKSIVEATRPFSKRRTTQLRALRIDRKSPHEEFRVRWHELGSREDSLGAGGHSCPLGGWIHR